MQTVISRNSIKYISTFIKYIAFSMFPFIITFFYFYNHDALNVYLIIVAIPICINVMYRTTRYLHEYTKKNMLWYLLYSYINTITILIFAYSSAYTHTGIKNSDDVITYDQMDCLYFSIVTWTTLGYGDFQPTEGARLIAASEALLGYIWMAILVGMVMKALGASTRKQAE